MSAPILQNPSPSYWKLLTSFTSGNRPLDSSIQVLSSQILTQIPADRRSTPETHTFSLWNDHDLAQLTEIVEDELQNPSPNIDLNEKLAFNDYCLRSIHETRQQAAVNEEMVPAQNTDLEKSLQKLSRQAIENELLKNPSSFIKRTFDQSYLSLVQEAILTATTSMKTFLSVFNQPSSNRPVASPEEFLTLRQEALNASANLQHYLSTTVTILQIALREGFMQPEEVRTVQENFSSSINLLQDPMKCDPETLLKLQKKLLPITHTWNTVAERALNCTTQWATEYSQERTDSKDSQKLERIRKHGDLFFSQMAFSCAKDLTKILSMPPRTEGLSEAISELKADRKLYLSQQIKTLIEAGTSLEQHGAITSEQKNELYSLINECFQGISLDTQENDTMPLAVLNERYSKLQAGIPKLSFVQQWGTSVNHSLTIMQQAHELGISDLLSSAQNLVFPPLLFDSKLTDLSRISIHEMATRSWVFPQDLKRLLRDKMLLDESVRNLSDRVTPLLDLEVSFIKELQKIGIIIPQPTTQTVTAILEKQAELCQYIPRLFTEQEKQCATAFTTQTQCLKNSTLKNILQDKNNILIPHPQNIVPVSLQDGALKIAEMGTRTQHVIDVALALDAKATQIEYFASLHGPQYAQFIRGEINREFSSHAPTSWEEFSPDLLSNVEKVVINQSNETKSAIEQRQAKLLRMCEATKDHLVKNTPPWIDLTRHLQKVQREAEAIQNAYEGRNTFPEVEQYLQKIDSSLPSQVSLWDKEILSEIDGYRTNIARQATELKNNILSLSQNEKLNSPALSSQEKANLCAELRRASVEIEAVFSCAHNETPLSKLKRIETEVQNIEHTLRHIPQEPKVFKKEPGLEKLPDKPNPHAEAAKIILAKIDNLQKKLFLIDEGKVSDKEKNQTALELVSFAISLLDRDGLSPQALEVCKQNLSSIHRLFVLTVKYGKLAKTISEFSTYRPQFVDLTNRIDALNLKNLKDPASAQNQLDLSSLIPTKEFQVPQQQAATSLGRTKSAPPQQQPQGPPAPSTEEIVAKALKTDVHEISSVVRPAFAELAREFRRTGRKQKTTIMLKNKQVVLKYSGNKDQEATIKQRLAEGGYKKVYAIASLSKKAFGDLGPVACYAKIKKDIDERARLEEIRTETYFSELCNTNKKQGEETNVMQVIKVSHLKDPKRPKGLLMPLCLCDLESVVKNNMWDKRTRLKLAMDTAHGLSVMHSHRVVHGDFKPTNVLVQQRGNDLVALITDFGFAQKIPDGPPPRTRPGTYPYAPKEVFSQSPKLSTSIDLFSLGLTILELMHGNQANKFLVLSQSQFLTPGQAWDAAHHAILSSLNTSDPIDRLILQLLDPNPSRRPSAAQVVDKIKNMLP